MILFYNKILHGIAYALFAQRNAKIREEGISGGGSRMDRTLNENEVMNREDQI
jgi:hypothetical protein